MSNSSDNLTEVTQNVFNSLATLEFWTRNHGPPTLSGFSRSSATEPRVPEMLKALEERLSLSLYEVRSRINSLAPINQLPDDILKSIFEWLSPPHISDFHPGIRENRRFEEPPSPQLLLQRWLDITRVCRHWRDVAMSIPTAWSTVAVGPCITPSKIVNMQLSYTKNAPIDLHFWPDVKPPEMFRFSHFDWDMMDLRPLVPRLKGLHLHAVGIGRAPGQLFTQLTIPAPMLEHLTLFPAGYNAYFRGPYPIESDDFYALPTLFQNHTPRLRSLTIAYFTSWSGNTFHNLTQLCLSDQHMGNARREEIFTWRCSFLIDFLRNSPLLEELILVNTAALRDDNIGSEVAPLRLLRLKTLVISTWNTTSITLFLSRVQVPAHCAVYMNSHESSKSVLEGMCSARSMANMEAHLRRITRLHLRTKHGEPSDHVLLGCGHSGFYLKVPHTPLSFHWNPDMNNLQSHMPEYEGEFSELPISPVHLQLYSMMTLDELWVDTHRYIAASVEQWKELYNATPNIKKLVIVAIAGWGEPNFRCLGAICPHPELPSICLPDLVDLHIICSDSNVISDDILATVREMRTWRMRAGYPVPQVTFGCFGSTQFNDAVVDSLYGEFGPQAVIAVGECAPFDCSPFSERSPYTFQYWPDDLSGGWPPAPVSPWTFPPSWPVALPY